MGKVGICLAFLVLNLSGCAIVASTISDSIKCHDECPGGLSKAEYEKCLQACEKRLAQKRCQDDRTQKEMEEKKQEYEWKQKVENQIREVTKGYRPLLQ
jgi:hypothetical protein